MTYCNLVIRLRRFPCERMDARGKHDSTWRLVAAELKLRGERHTAVWFATPGRPNGDYYTFDGRPLAGLRFAVPVAHSQISSPFGMRWHPVTGGSTAIAAPTSPRRRARG